MKEPTTFAYFPIFPVTRIARCIFALTVLPDHEKLTGWHLADANAHQMLDYHTDDDTSDLPAIKSLTKELAKRRNQNVTIIVASEQTLAVLRTRLAKTDAISNPSPHGYKYLSINMLIQRYFIPDQYEPLLNKEFNPDQEFIEGSGRHRELSGR